MSEMRYRRLMEMLLPFHSPHVPYHQEQAQFIRAALLSQLPIVEQCRLLIARDDDPDMVYRVVDLASHVFIHELVPDLIDLFEQSDNQELKLLIIRALSRLRHEQAFAFLVEILVHHADVTFRETAAYALKDIVLPQASLIPPLTAAVHNTDEEPQVRSYVVGALAFHGGKPVLPLILTLLHDPEAKVRFAAVCSVGQLGNRSLAPYLEPFLTDTTTSDGVSLASEVAERFLAKWAKEDN